MRTIMVTAALMLTLAGAAWAQSLSKGPLTLSGMQLRATVRGVPTSAAYMTIENHGKTPDRLLSIDCACADGAMMHESRTRSGISSMVMLKDLTIPAGGKVTFKPEGLHVMLVGLKAPLKAGGLQEMTLRFEKAGVVRAGFHVRDVISK